MSRAEKPSATLLTRGAGCRDEGGPRGEPPHNFVRLADVAPGIRQDMRYAGSENFMGRPVPGYCAGQCWLRREVAEALAAAQRDAESSGRSLIVYDCYRPQRATRAFLAWAADPADELMKAEYYPHLGKETLFDLGYIARESAHSTGVAVDLALIGRDFGTPFDLFDAASGSRFEELGAEAKQNRAELFALMGRHGFVNFDKEWWHFTLENLEGVAPHDFDVR